MAGMWAYIEYASVVKLDVCGLHLDRQHLYSTLEIICILLLVTTSLLTFLPKEFETDLISYATIRVSVTHSIDFKALLYLILLLETIINHGSQMS
jgi:hypothetical protein